MHLTTRLFASYCLIFVHFISFADCFSGILEKPRYQSENQQIPKKSKTEKRNDFSAYPHLTDEMKKRMGPYLIDSSHPMKKKLDAIFLHSRVTRNEKAFLDAGFRVLEEGRRSFIVVAKHKQLSGHLVKCFLDTEMREKWSKPSWYWLAKRCEGAKKIRKIIVERKIKHFRVPQKYIYLLPLLDTKKPFKERYTRHPALLLVTDMDLVSEKQNLYAWKNRVNKEVLDELYTIITLAKGSSYRADNIAYSRSGKFCFIDCEYPSSEPDYKRIRPYLNSKMRKYWDLLVEKGAK
ncbi:MAG: hypothetical protein ACHQUC_03700 [Chlamydiales bacterium]